MYVRRDQQGLRKHLSDLCVMTGFNMMITFAFALLTIDLEESSHLALF